MSIQDTKSLNPFDDGQGKGNKFTEKKQSVIQSFLSQFLSAEKQFYQDSIVLFQKVSDHEK